MCICAHIGPDVILRQQMILNWTGCVIESVSHDTQTKSVNLQLKPIVLQYRELPDAHSTPNIA